MTFRRGVVAGPSLLAGVLLALSVPPFGIWPSALVGAALLYWRLDGLALRTRMLSGWVAGVGCFSIGLFWAQDFNWYGALVLVAVESLSLALLAVATPRYQGRLPAYVGAATLVEALRLSWPFGGLPPGGVFLGQANGPLLAVARLGGPLALTALVWLSGAVLAELLAWLVRGRGGYGPRHPWSWLAPGALVVALAVAGALAPDGGAPVALRRVAEVQGGGRRGYTELETGQAGDFAAQLAASAPLTRLAHPPSLVLWPEDVVALDRSLRSSHAASELSFLARSLHATLLVGVTITEPQNRFRNEVVAWGPEGRIVSVFEKVHRVPFGEYIPWRSLVAHLANLAAVPRDAIAGHSSGLMATPAGPLGVLVSFEVFFANRGRSSVRSGAELLVVPTNSSSYSSKQMPSQELAADRVQAVAEGRDLVQSATTGYSAVITNRGAIVTSTPLSVRRLVVATVALRRGATVYERLGDLPVLVLSALALIVGLAVQLLTRPKRPL